MHVRHDKGLILDPIEDKLMEWFMKQQEVGVPLATRRMAVKVIKLSPELGGKTKTAQIISMQRFVKRNKVALRRGSTISQKQPQDNIDMALGFLKVVCPVMGASEVDRCLTINMDQTPVLFNLNPNLTLNPQGQRTTVFASTHKGTQLLRPSQHLITSSS